MAIKAIETAYGGHRFRSRLEARWAVFFNALGLNWRYEVEGFKLGSFRYLPDFWFPDSDSYFEIKGPVPSAKELRKSWELHSRSGRAVLLLAGDIWPGRYQVYTCQGDGSDTLSLVASAMMTTCNDCGGLVIISPKLEWASCGKYEPDKAAHAWTILWHGHGSEASLTHCPPEMGHSCYNPTTSKLHQAYTAARQARFEHGEAPR